ncbi:hypothetical protein GF373_02180 [bacterium]|nr:hypothetical protein [bacterium]
MVKVAAFILAIFVVLCARVHSIHSDILFSTDTPDIRLEPGMVGEYLFELGDFFDRPLENIVFKQDRNIFLNGVVPGTSITSKKGLSIEGGTMFPPT